jgi:hypothetical protein
MQIIRIALDLAKNIIQVHAVDRAGKPVLRDPGAGGLDIGYVYDSASYLTTGSPLWREIPICTGCQGQFPPSLFPPNVMADPGGPWGRK